MHIKSMYFLLLISLSASSRVRAGGELNEELCSRDNQCLSGHCLKEWHSFWTGVCCECETHDDCEGKGISRPGELPKAFCYQEEGTKKFCSKWKHGKPIDGNGYPLHLPSKANKGPDWIRRFIHEVDNEPAMSQVWHWDLNNQPEGTTIDVNETHVSIPLYTQTLAGYSRTYHVFGNEHETGIATSTFMSNQYSIISTKAYAGMTEKYHTLTYDGVLPTSRADRIKEELRNRPAKMQRRAEQGYKVRSYAQMGALIPAKVADTFLEAGQDQVHLESLRKYVKGLLLESSTIKVNHDNFWLPSWSAEAKEALEYAKSYKSIKSENHCKHFEDGYGIVVTDTHIEIPLNSPWVTLGGETATSPEYHMGFNTGISIAKYDTEKNSLEFHYKAYQQFRYYADPEEDRSEEPIQSALWLAQFSPEHPISDVDGRSDQYYRLEPYWYQGMLASYKKIPIDYSIYDRGNDICDKKVREKLSGKWDDAKLEQAQVQETDNVLEDLMDLHSLMQILVDGAACSNFMKADFGPNTTGFGTLEFFVSAHLILEFDPHVTEEMATKQFWDDWDTFYKNTASI
mmetsp:Transcript_3737/g.4148  ORF Transcript_3737/g.4148 Transcript_3737/m.4148 type:complete len:570 (+) Transcript_3737:2-1711(+)